MTKAIAHYVRTQQSDIVKKTEAEKRLSKEFTFEFEEDEPKGDYGRTINII